MRLFQLYPLIILLSVATAGCGGLPSTDDIPARSAACSTWGMGFRPPGAVPLSGEWEFYWNDSHAPRRFAGERPPPRTGYATFPGTWKDLTVNGAKLPGTGYATYRLVVLLEGRARTSPYEAPP